MELYKRLVWIGLLLAWSSCNRYTDNQPTPDSGPPPGSIQALTKQYPQAQDIVLTTVANNQLWQATFMQQRQRYQALVSPNRLLTADRLIDDALADSLVRLLDPTVMAGGTYKNPRYRQYMGWFTNPVISGPPAYVHADYTWQQQPFTAYWFIVRPGTGPAIYNLELLPYQLDDYQTTQLTDLPEVIQQTLRDEGLVFSNAVVQLDASHKRRYQLSVQQPKLPASEQFLLLTYDDDGQLLTAVNQQSSSAQVIKQLDQLPPVILDYLQRPELAGFSLNQNSGFYGYSMRYTYGTRITYQISMLKDKQAWLLQFSDKGQLIRRSFLTVGYF